MRGVLTRWRAAAWGKWATGSDATPAVADAPAQSGVPERARGPQRWQRVPLDSIGIEWHDRQVELLDLADALDELAKQHARLNDVIILHWFGGLKYADVACMLGVSPSTVEKDFRYALAWLNRRLDGANGDA